MSIKKCIMNYFDKATNAMIPFHQQTESGAITDWHESIIGSLASKVLPTVVSELTTDSVLGKLMKLLLNASGMKYSMGANGYICFGSLFGGLIIQWVCGATNTKQSLALPIAFTTHGLGVGNDYGRAANRIGVAVDTVSTYIVYARPDNSSELTITSFNGIFIGY